jgi:hypothetical protein
MSGKKYVSAVPFAAFLHHIGYCPKCMKQAMVMAILLDATAVASRFLQLPSRVNAIVLCVAICSTALLVAHIVAYAARATRREQALRGSAANSASRRSVFLLFARGLAGAVVMAAFPSFAQSTCPGRLDCGQTNCLPDVTCCPSGYPLLDVGNCRCYPAHTRTPSGRVIACG